MVEMVWSAIIDIKMVGIDWNGSNGNGIVVVEMVFLLFSFFSLFLFLSFFFSFLYFLLSFCLLFFFSHFLLFFFFFFFSSFLIL